MRDGKVALEFADAESITADAMLIAAGRTPNLRALNLEAAGVDYDKQG
jgi:Pyruvate/2-oxoglutarate dehydrogenase complex, dihydrolipoamide dehydrogenase (E3) component, and related enzymes